MKGGQRNAPIYNFTSYKPVKFGLHVRGRMAACCQWPPKHHCPFDPCCQAGLCVPGLSWHSHNTSHSSVCSFNTVPPLFPVFSTGFFICPVQPENPEPRHRTEKSLEGEEVDRPTKEPTTLPSSEEALNCRRGSWRLSWIFVGQNQPR